MASNDIQSSSNFIRQIISNDLQTNKNEGRIVTRFPPEPNGYLHIGHAKSICLNFGLAKEFSGQCNLRFDDTNPEKESEEYAQAIEEDVRWLGFEWQEKWHSSDYFEQFYGYAVALIKAGKAYVESLNAEQIRQHRGSLTEPGTESADRNRSVEENLNLFAAMRNGDFETGTYVLRAKIDMASPNLNLRDPTIYRIRFSHHQRTGNDWCIYPMYDFAHCISDAIECITHSICTLEFEDHRPLYDWFLDQLDVPSHPQQIEFSRLSLEFTVMSKRKLNQLVLENHVSGWDDPRMPTIAGMRRAGFTAKAIRDFCESIGVTKKNAWIKIAVLENYIREDLNDNAPRAMAVLKPLRVIIENYPADATQQLALNNHPQKPELGIRQINFTNEIFIEQDDFAEIPPAKFKRLIPGGEVRLRGAYVIKCNEVIKDSAGQVLELKCSYDPDTLGKKPEGRKVKGVIHWVSAQHAVPAEIHLYDRLFNIPNPDVLDDFRDALNPDSLVILEDCLVEESLSDCEIGKPFQFERTGYFCRDRQPANKNKMVFNRTVTLRDTWAKIESAG